MTLENESPVAIVGGGPVGLMLALFLDLYGIRSVIFNLDEETRWHPKGNTHNARTMEHYRRLGISQSIRALGLPKEFPLDVSYFTRLNGWELARINMPSGMQKISRLKHAVSTDPVPEPLMRVNQMYVEKFLLQHARSRPNITMRYGWRVKDFIQFKDQVKLYAECIKGKHSDEVWHTSYMIGCDGGQSFVRSKLGIAYEGTVEAKIGFLTGGMISSYIRIPELHQGILKDQKSWMYNIISPTLRMLFISLDGKDEFLLMTQSEHGKSINESELIRIAQAGIGSDIEVSVLSNSVWKGGVALVAERFSDGKIYLAGDSAHLFSPTGGFGMNTGIDDTSNLAWKIAASLKGWAGNALMDSYESERRPIALRNTAAARFLTQRVSSLSIPTNLEDADFAGNLARKKMGIELSAFRNQFSSIGVELGARYDHSPHIINSAPIPDDDFIHYQPSHVPGGRLPHLWLTPAPGTRISLFDILGTGFSLLRVGAYFPAVSELLDQAYQRKIPIKIIDLSGSDAWQLYQARLLLVRPDQYIAWKGDEVPHNIGSILDKIIGN
ncbi:monooxygenase [Photorhabdus noenieputensis]|uniref:FAD-dependent oxidoreductase n=1 Tax=Photorhabdus noenieputensis TaxID=1208607 RepID=UPI001BD4B6F0|nr:FAD-dependent oxidoreductase [Photorhabdus noenieputensis]MBS9437973.1 monooxygenase [Photorhabdus noenieputensis]MCK3671287.1 FAD-dependent oxidoreductase [Photorhabdus noenieputensis]